jgi:metal-responsive CopG/Arc/MetJ family transcriptional regulator
MEESYVQALDELAERRDTTRSDIIRRVLKRYVHTLKNRKEL